jgi:hypothetical protein
MSVTMRRSSSSSALLERRPSFKNLFIEADRPGDDCLLTVFIDPERPTILPQGTRASDVQTESFVEFMRQKQKQTRIASPISWQKRGFRSDDKGKVPGLFTFLRVFFLYLQEPFSQTSSKPLDEYVDVADEYYW